MEAAEAWEVACRAAAELWEAAEKEAGAASMAADTEGVVAEAVVVQAVAVQAVAAQAATLEAVAVQAAASEAAASEAMVAAVEPTVTDVVADPTEGHRGWVEGLLARARAAQRVAPRVAPRCCRCSRCRSRGRRGRMLDALRLNRRGRSLRQTWAWKCSRGNGTRRSSALVQRVLATAEGLMEVKWGTGAVVKVVKAVTMVAAATEAAATAALEMAARMATD